MTAIGVICAIVGYVAYRTCDADYNIDAIWDGTFACLTIFGCVLALAGVTVKLWEVMP